MGSVEELDRLSHYERGFGVGEKKGWHDAIDVCKGIHERWVKSLVLIPPIDVDEIMREVESFGKKLGTLKGVV